MRKLTMIKMFRESTHDKFEQKVNTVINQLLLDDCDFEFDIIDDLKSWCGTIKVYGMFESGEEV